MPKHRDGWFTLRALANHRWRVSTWSCAGEFATGDGPEDIREIGPCTRTEAHEQAREIVELLQEGSLDNVTLRGRHNSTD